MKRRPVPGHPTVACATPADWDLIRLLGGHTSESVAFTRDQARALRRYYGFDDAVTTAMVEDSRAVHEEAQKKKAAEEEALPAWQRRGRKPHNPEPFNEQAVRNWFDSKEAVSLFRHAREDGMRLMGLLSRYLQAGEDPVCLVVRLLADAGYDVDPSVFEWAEQDEWREEEVDEP